MGVSAPTLSPASASPRARMSQPVWRPDAASSSCLCCSKAFSFINRRHHCRVCGELVCAACSPYMELQPEYGYDSAVRVCTGCTKSGSLLTASTCTTSSEASNSDSELGDLDDDYDIIYAALETLEIHSSLKHTRLQYEDFVQSEAVSWLVDDGVVSNRKTGTALFTRLIDDEYVKLKPWVGSSRSKFYVLCDDLSSLGSRLSHYGRGMHSETNKCSNCSQCFLESLTPAPGFCSIDCKTNSLISQADSARVRRML